MYEYKVLKLRTPEGFLASFSEKIGEINRLAKYGWHIIQVRDEEILMERELEVG